MLTRASTRTLSLLSSGANPTYAHAPLTLRRPGFSTFPLICCPLFSSSPYPLYYELISYRPARRSPRHLRSGDGTSADSLRSEPSGGGVVEDGGETEGGQTTPMALDRSQRKYYRKRTKRMYGGSDSDGDGGSRGREEFVELEAELVDFPRLHSREEELYFYDAFALPWEKEKHYRMVYQLEKKYFPDQCLDRAFVEPAREPASERKSDGEKKSRLRKKGVDSSVGEMGEGRSLIFFEDQKELQADSKKTAAGDISEKKVEGFFKSLKKGPSTAAEKSSHDVTNVEPFLVSTKTGLPPKWDGTSGTVVLVDKPKGWTSFSVCGKLRRLVKVQKVGHAGTLDPLATGLLIVCVGKATKIVERYQGMIKGYSGVFRLGEATSTWDADSPIIQREPWEHIKDEDIKKVASSFSGEIWQVPPMFSAIKVCGEKLYEKARRGETMELSPRRISIFQLDIERSLEDRQNLIFRVTCSKGTYIRSLCADFGKALGSCAHLTTLRRDLIGQYSVDDAWDFQKLQEQITKSYL